MAEALSLSETFVGQMERGQKPIERRTALAALCLRFTGGRIFDEGETPDCWGTVELEIAKRKTAHDVQMPAFAHCAGQHEGGDQPLPRRVSLRPLVAAMVDVPEPAEDRGDRQHMRQEAQQDHSHQG
jgi:hypothetical protein